MPVMLNEIRSMKYIPVFW